jgi:hypothetical protein
MASINGVLSPPSHSDYGNVSLSLSAKRKRADSIEVQNHINGDSKGAESSQGTLEDSRAQVKDLIDVLKM